MSYRYLTLGLILVLLVTVNSAHAQKVTLIAVGDICLTDAIEREMHTKGSDYPFRAMAKTLRGADITFGNLECCLALGGKIVPKQFNFRGDPANAKALKDAAFKIVSLANNHTLDYGRSALLETIGALERHGIPHAGAGRTKAEAHRPVILNVKGVKIGFLAYLGLFPAILPEREKEPSVAMAVLSALRSDIAALRPQVDFIIVSLHAGVERKFHHSPRQESIAHAMIDAGADMVIGHHPHVVEDVETYRGKPIFYSLGNFVFEPSASSRQAGGRHWSGMIRATLERGKPIVAKLEELRLVGRQPRLMR